MNLITFELEGKNGFSKNPIYGFNNRYFAKPTSPSYFSVIFAQLLYYMFFARTDRFWDFWDFVFFCMFWTRCLRPDWSRIIQVIKLNHMSNPRLNPALWHIKIICIRTNNLGRYMENTMGNIERFVKFGDVFLCRGCNLNYLSLNEGSALTKSIITVNHHSSPCSIYSWLYSSVDSAPDSQPRGTGFESWKAIFFFFYFCTSDMYVFVFVCIGWM